MVPKRPAFSVFKQASLAAARTSRGLTSPFMSGAVTVMGLARGSAPCSALAGRAGWPCVATARTLV
jgi:hypothetical protein